MAATNTVTAGVIGDWLLECGAYTDGTAPVAWTPVYGIQEFTPPQTEKDLQDDTQFDGSHWGSQIGTKISWTAAATVLVNRAALTEDPGQAILRAASRGIAEEGFVHFRFSKRGVSPQAGEEGVADVSLVEQGGSKEALTTAEVTMTGRGALTEFTAGP